MLYTSTVFNRMSSFTDEGGWKPWLFLDGILLMWLKVFWTCSGRANMVGFSQNLLVLTGGLGTQYFFSGCSHFPGNGLELELLDTEEDIMIHQNSGNYSLSDTASHPRRLESSETLL